MKKPYILLIFSSFCLASCANSTAKFSVMWNNDDGKNLETDNDVLVGSHPIYDGEEPSSKVEPTEHYHFVFSGWKDQNGNEYTDEYKMPNKDIIFTAQYVEMINQHTITWQNDNKEVLKVSENIEYNTHVTYDGDDPTSSKQKTGYHYDFSGWKDTDGKILDNKYLMPDKDVTFIAQYKENLNEHKVTWVNDNGAEIEVDQKVKYSKHPSYDSDEPTSSVTPQEGYRRIFNGWKDADDNEYNSSYKMPDKDVVFTAQYKDSNEYKVTWLNDNNSQLFEHTYVYKDRPVYGGERPRSTKGTPAGGQYVFTGWLDQDGIEYDQNYRIKDKDVTFTAQYEKTENFLVEWVNYDDSLIEQEIYHSDTFPEYKGDLPSRKDEDGKYYLFKDFGQITEVKTNCKHKATYEEYDINTTVIRSYIGYSGYEFKFDEIDPVEDGGSFTIDWGDGTVEDNKLNHTYNATTNNLTIKITNAKRVVKKNDQTIFKVGFGDTITDVTGSLEACSKLEYVRLPSKLKEIGSQAFQGCSKLTGVVIPKTATIISSHAFENNTKVQHIDIPSTIQNISIYAFQGCTSLKSIYLPDNIDYLGAWAFKGCTNLVNVTLPEKIRVLEYNIFEDCTALKNVGIDKNVSQICEESFKNCTSLTFIKFPSSLIGIGESSFSGCTSLARIDISDNNNVISGSMHMFEGCPLGENSIHVKSQKLIGAYKEDAFWSNYIDCMYAN